jgi:hypothetical protein
MPAFNLGSMMGQPARPTTTMQAPSGYGMAGQATPAPQPASLPPQQKQAMVGALRAPGPTGMGAYQNWGNQQAAAAPPPNPFQGAQAPMQGALQGMGSRPGLPSGFSPMTPGTGTMPPSQGNPMQGLMGGGSPMRSIPGGSAGGLGLGMPQRSKTAPYM